MDMKYYSVDKGHQNVNNKKSVVTVHIWITEWVLVLLVYTLLSNGKCALIWLYGMLVAI